MKRTILLLLLLVIPVVQSCRKECRPSEMDCTAIKFACDPGDEVCGCDGRTYDCELEAECVGRIRDYKKGKCK